MSKFVDLAIIEDLCLENYFTFDGKFPYAVFMEDGALEFCWTDETGEELRIHIVEIFNNGATFNCTDIDGYSHNLMFLRVYNPLDDE